MKFFKPISVSIQGTSNFEANIENQDAVASYVKNGVSVSVLSDGAPTAYSEEAASLIVTSICKYIVANFTKMYSNEDELEVKRELVDSLLSKLERKVKKYNCDIEEFAATLVFVAVKDNEQFLAGHIGDGCICSKNEDGWYVLSSEDEEETQFISTANVYAAMRLYKGEVSYDSAFALMSNGTMSAFVQEDLEITSGIDIMNSWIEEYPEEVAVESIVDTLENQVKEITNEDCSICYISLVDYPCEYDVIDNDAKTLLFEKHYSHIYNAIAAMEDADKIVEVLKTTNANVQYISKKSKVKSSSCQKLTEILSKANLIQLTDDLFSLVLCEVEVNEE